MPIFDQGYRHLDREIGPPTRRFWTITATGVRLALKKKTMIVLLLLSAAPFLVALVTIYVLGTAEQAGSSIDPRMAEAARESIHIDGAFFWQFFFVWHTTFLGPVIALFVGAGLIADDRRTNALEIYFSRPISKLDYLLGKLGILIVFGLFTTLAEGALLYIVHVSMKGDFSYVLETRGLLFGIVAASILITVPIACAVLAVSSFAKSARFAGLAWFGFWMLTGAMGGILTEISRSDGFAIIGFQMNVEQVVSRVLEGKPHFDYPWGRSLAILAGIVVLSFLILWRRIRPVEIVS